MSVDSLFSEIVALLARKIRYGLFPACDYMILTLVCRANSTQVKPAVIVQASKQASKQLNFIFTKGETMANIHFVGGEKGGVGKSVVARVLAQYMIDREIPFCAFDTDRSHGSLLRFYANYSVSTQIEAFESLDAIVEAAIEDNNRHILVDLAAQTFHPFVKWFEETGVAELTEKLGITVTYWNVMDSGKDSVDLLDPLFAQYAPNMNYILVLNALRGDNFEIFENSEARKQALELDAKIMPLKRLHPPLMQKIDATSASFWAAKNSVPGSTVKLGLLERHRVKIWLREVYHQLDLLGV